VNKLKLHPQARQELDGARRYYRERDPEVARRFARSVFDMLQRIASEPAQFPKHGLLAVPTSRGTLFFDVYRAVLPRTFPYVLFFFVSSGTSIVLAVAHGKRRPGYWTARTDDENPRPTRAKTVRKA
jgi:plasmid stabilization system protein ParE